MAAVKYVALLLLLAATAAQAAANQEVAWGHSGRHLLQGSAAPANCSGPGDKWTPSSITCAVEGGRYAFTCDFQKESGNALCKIQGPEPQQLIGMTCPVKSGKAVCDMVVAQNFTYPDVVFGIVALLSQWSPAA